LLKNIISVPIAIVALLMLSACSFLDEVNNSLEYANQAKSYIDKTQKFAEDIPQLTQDAVSNSEARQKLESELQNMKTEINNFNGIEVPSIAEDVHSQIRDYNQKLEEGINSFQKNMEAGKLDPSILENTEIMQTVSELKNILNQVEKLGG
jgi:hypothetical protein